MSQNETHTSETADVSHNTDHLNETDPATPAPTTTDMQYRCPHCEATYDHELLTRIHITRCDDDSHQTHNGLMPEAEIAVVDHDDTVIETVTTHPDEIDLDTLTTDIFSDELSEWERQTLLVAAQNPHDSTYTDLKDRVHERLTDSDIEPPSYQQVRRITRSFWEPHRSDTHRTPKSSLSEMTPLQQSIVVAQLVCPDRSNSEIADLVGCAETYPGQVCNQASRVLNQLQSRLDDGMELTEILRDELQMSEIAALQNEDYLDDVPVAIDSIVDSDADSGSDPSARDDGDSTDEAKTAPSWGSPVDEQTGLRATPELPSATTNTETTTDQDDGSAAGPARENTDQADDSRQHDPHSAIDEHTSDTVPATELHLLTEKVRFLREVLGAADDEPMQIAESMAEQIEAECVAMLQD